MSDNIEKDDQITPQTRLHQMSESVQTMELIVVDLYNAPGVTESYTASVQKLQDAVQSVGNRIGALRSIEFSDLTAPLQTFQISLDEQLSRLQAIVDFVNNANQILEIATEVAEIAAGMAKL